MSEALPTTADPGSGQSARRAVTGVPAFAWGYNARAGLGLGHTSAVMTPMATRLPAGTTDVQGGLNFSVALTRKGQVFSWGGNQNGQLGHGTTTVGWKAARVKLPGGAKVRAIAVGADHVIAVTTRGFVYTWGRNHRGQLGDGSATDRHSPIRLTKGIKGAVRRVAAGNGISAAVTETGNLYLWGRNTFGQLGLGAAPTPAVEAISQSTPAKVKLPRGTHAVAVAAGNRHVTVALSNGRLLALGLDARGQTSEGTIRLTSAWGRPTRLAAGEDFTLVLTDRHVLLAFGGNASGQLGTGDHTNRLHPTRVILPHAKGHVVDIFAGARGAAALTSSGQVYTWGDGNVGQHGAGMTAKALHPKPTPARVKALDGARVTKLHGGHHHAFVSVTHGPPVALRLRPSQSVVQPGATVSYRVHEVDAFGNDLGPTTQFTLKATDGKVAIHKVTVRTLGVHQVTAHSGHLSGSTTLTVAKGPRP